MKPGIYPNTPREQYEQVEAVNQSTLKLFSRTPAHARYAMLHKPAPSAAMELGTATHAAILEPDTVFERFAVAPKCDRRTKAGKDQWTEFEALNRGKILLKQDEWDQIAGMRGAVMEHATARELVKGKGQNELMAVAKDPDTGEVLKALMDRVTAFQGWTVVVDLKTCEDASEWAFSRDCAKYEYHIQAAFYLDVLNAIAAHDRRFWFVAIEKSPPFELAVYELDEDSLQQGRMEYRDRLAKFIECKKSGDWPGYGTGVFPLRLPEWKLRRKGEIQ